MNDWSLFLLIVPIEVLLIFWAALIVLAVKGLIFHRGKVHQPDQPRVQHEDETMRPAGLSFGCSACLLFIFWPMMLALMLDRWLGRKPPTQF
jgi:hypothetical protein